MRQDIKAYLKKVASIPNPFVAGLFILAAPVLIVLRYFRRVSF